MPCARSAANPPARRAAFLRRSHGARLRPCLRKGTPIETAGRRDACPAPMNVLVIAPHPDDESIGCGGALCLHARRGDRITVVYLTSGELGLKHLPRQEAWHLREREARRAAKILGIARLFFLRLADWFVSDAVAKGAAKLRPILRRAKPDLIYVPHEQDWHPDHKAALPMLRAALKSSRAVT